MARYRIDPSRSKVEIDARSSMHPIHTVADGLEGWLELDVQGGGRVNPMQAASGRLEFPVEQLRSGNPLEDRELRRRLDVRKFPTIVGELREVEETGRDGRYLVRGDVTFKGVTRTSADEMTIADDGTGTLLLEGSSTFDIREFGMEPPKILMLRVEPQVIVRVAVVADKEH